MDPKFAFSFDRESFQGQYATRQQAVDAAMALLPTRTELPDAVFVGRWIDPSLNTEGHAENIIETLRDRWNSSDTTFLEKVSDQQLADLDAEIDRTIRTWLTKHDLAPRPTSVRAVSEQPVQNTHSVAAPAHGLETSIIGRP
ncbi:MAG: hypothetical protein H7144_11155 [Burkholderiales bacterium]|nr:hypothetical protein [Phycisphaerae bacterium]